jgi:putative endonuclease
VTNHLIRRVYEHKNKMVDGFTKKYNVDRLVHYETYSDISDAIAREKEIKGWSRAKKNVLINQGNPKWEDLFNEII